MLAPHPSSDRRYQRSALPSAHAQDDALARRRAIAQAREILGTTGIADTINAALRDAIRRATVNPLIERVATMAGLNLSVFDGSAGAWR
jgi:hypothetical protein